MATFDMNWPGFVSSQKPSTIPNSAADLEYYDFTSQAHMSDEKHPGWLGYIGDYILSRYIAIISQAMTFSDPYNLNNQYDSWIVTGVFFSWLTCHLQETGCPKKVTSQVATKVLQIPETLWPLLPSLGGGSGWKSSCWMCGFKGDLYIYIRIDTYIYILSVYIYIL